MSEVHLCDSRNYKLLYQNYHQLMYEARSAVLVSA